MAPVGRYIQAVGVAIAEDTRPGSTTGRVITPEEDLGGEQGAASGTLYTPASPAPPPHATTSRRCSTGIRLTTRIRTLPDAPPINLGAASRPIDAPIR